MNILLNGQPKTLLSVCESEFQTNTLPLQQVLRELRPQEPFAIMLNQEFVPKSQYEAFNLYEGDALEIVGAIQGG